MAFFVYVLEHPYSVQVLEKKLYVSEHCTNAPPQQQYLVFEMTYIIFFCII